MGEHVFFKSVGCSKSRETKSTQGHGRREQVIRIPRNILSVNCKHFSIITTLPSREMHFFYFFACLQPFEREKFCNVLFAISFTTLAALVKATPTNQTDSVYFHTYTAISLGLTRRDRKQHDREDRNEPLCVKLGKAYLNGSFHSSQSPSRTVQIANTTALGLNRQSV